MARFWIHGRTLTVTRIVSLVVFLTVIVPTAPRFAVVSTEAGVIETPPCWAACATRRRVVRAGDHAAGRGPRDGKAEGAGDQPTPNELHFGYLLVSLSGRTSVESVTRTTLR